MLLGVVTGLLLATAPDAAATPTTPSAAPQQPEEKKICRREVETGSLIKGTKICMTAKQWQRISDANRDEIERTSSMGSQSGK
jgi:hypothetical protein